MEFKEIDVTKLKIAPQQKYFRNLTGYLHKKSPFFNGFQTF